MKQLHPTLSQLVSDLILRQVNTPQIAICKHLIEHNFRFFKRTMKLGDNSVFYAVKANNNASVIKTLVTLGAGFEIASTGELSVLKQLQIPPERVIFSNPVKIPSHIEEAAKYGINTFAYDTEHELHKIKQYAPGSSVILRTAITNKGADWPLTGKFGTIKEQIIPLLQAARKYGLTVTGIAFHIGWNNPDIDTWRFAVEQITEICKLCSQNGIRLQTVNMGGGFPAHNVDQYDLFTEITKAVEPYLLYIKKNMGINVIAEPGSFIVANAGIMLVRIYDIVHRHDNDWIFVDSGINQGFYWIYCKMKYNIIYPYPDSAKQACKQFTITGPTCDSHDIFAENVLLPETVSRGNYLLIYPAGAYVSSAMNYNGFGYPAVKTYES